MTIEAIKIWRNLVLTPGGLWADSALINILLAMKSRSPVSVLFEGDLERLEEYIHLITLAEEYLAVHPADDTGAVNLLKMVLQDEKMFSAVSGLKLHTAQEIQTLLSPVVSRLRTSFAFVLERECGERRHPKNALEVLRGGGDSGKIKCHQCGKIMLPSELG